MAQWPDYEMELLLSLHGQEFEFAEGYSVKYKVRQVVAGRNRPDGLKNSVTLHDPDGKRIFGIDNAHKIQGRPEFDHRHVHGTGTVAAYQYRNPVALLEDFLREVEK